MAQKGPAGMGQVGPAGPAASSSAGGPASIKVDAGLEPALPFRFAVLPDVIFLPHEFSLLASLRMKPMPAIHRLRWTADKSIASGGVCAAWVVQATGMWQREHLIA